MKLTPEERKQKKARFNALTPKQKLEHIWLYQRLPIILVIIAISLLVSGIHRAVTHKAPVLYVGFLNVSVGSELESELTECYLVSRGYDPNREEILLYKDLYITNNPSAENHEYAYASSMKIMATINSKELDLVLMNREAYDLCSGSGYLLDLTSLFSPGDPRNDAIAPYLTSNLVVLEDNATEFNLGEAEEYIAVTESSPNALALSKLPLFEQAGFSGEVYLGIIANTPRQSACTNYITFLISPSPEENAF